MILLDVKTLHSQSVHEN